MLVAIFYETDIVTINKFAFIMHNRIWIVLKSLKIDFTSLLAPKKASPFFDIIQKISRILTFFVFTAI